MNHKSTYKPTEPKIKVVLDHSFDLMFTTQHIRDCCTESASTVASDYKDLFENLKNVPEPLVVMSVFHNHLQNRFLHNVQSWNDLRIAVVQNQMAMTPWFRYEVPTSATHNTNDSAKEQFSFKDPFSSVFNYMAGTVQNIRAGHDEADTADAALHKSIPVKNGKLHVNHPKHVDGRI